MAQVLTQTLGGGDADPYAALIQAQRAKVDQPVAPLYTPEQQQQRVAQNEREYAMGLMMALSGDETLGNVGGTVLQKSLAARMPKVTERGTMDQLRGTFQYSPDYLQQREQEKLAGLERAQAGYVANKQSAAAAQEAARERDRERSADRRFMATLAASNRPEKMAWVVGTDGQPVFIPQSQIGPGMRPYTPSGGNATADERKSAGFAQRMENAAQLVESNKENAPGYAGAIAAQIPYVGKYAQRAVEDTNTQKYRNAAMEWIRAKLRKESGAVIGAQEFEDEFATYFPLPGEDDEVKRQKADLRKVAEQSMAMEAGRAYQPFTGGASGGWDPAPQGPQKPPGAAAPAPVGGQGWGIRLKSPGG